MESNEKTTISVHTKINAPIHLVWKYWTTPNDIVKWNHANDEWHTTKAENDLRKWGKFNYRMEAKDGSFGFDFAGAYDKVKTNKSIEYTLGDGRKVKISFSEVGGKTEVIETFEAESENSVELQHNGWQAILDNFKIYTESNNNN